MDIPYDEIDSVCNYGLTNIYTLSKVHNVILLDKFNSENEDHLFLLNLCFIARDIFDWPMYYIGDFWSWIKLIIRARKDRKKVFFRFIVPWRRNKYMNVNRISADSFLEFMKPLLATLNEQGYTYADIYKLYYSNERNVD